jgi:hypothetical protein
LSSTDGPQRLAQGLLQLSDADLTHVTTDLTHVTTLATMRPQQHIGTVDGLDPDPCALVTESPLAALLW